MASRGLLYCLLAPLLLQVSCTTSGGGARPATPMTAASLGRIGLATSHGEPSYAFEALGKGEAAAAGAFSGVGGCLDLLFSTGEPAVSGALLAVCLPIAMIAGAIYRGGGAAPASSVSEARDRAQADLAALRLSQDLRQLLLDHAQLLHRYRFPVRLCLVWQDLVHLLQNRWHDRSSWPKARNPPCGGFPGAVCW